MVATIAAATGRAEAWLDALRGYLWDNLLLVQRRLGRPSATRLEAPQTSYLAWIDVSALGIDDAALRTDLIGNENSRSCQAPRTLDRAPPAQRRCPAQQGGPRSLTV